MQIRSRIQAPPAGRSARCGASAACICRVQITLLPREAPAAQLLVTLSPLLGPNVASLMCFIRAAFACSARAVPFCSAACRASVQCPVLVVLM